jgi:hypothetical protein
MVYCELTNYIICNVINIDLNQQVSMDESDLVVSK